MGEHRAKLGSHNYPSESFMDADGNEMLYSLRLGAKGVSKRVKL